MASESRRLPIQVEAIIKQINDIHVHSNNHIITTDQLEVWTRRYTEDLRPGTYLVGTAQEEEELASHGNTRNIHGVEFAAPPTFGFPDMDIDEEEEDIQDEPMVDLHPAADDTFEDEDILIRGSSDRRLWVNGEVWHVAEYLGKHWVDMIMQMHSIKPLPTPVGMVVKPYDYQLKGAAQMDWCLEGPFKFFFLGDRMGMGKTLTTTLALWMRKDEPGMSLVVAPASVCAQWVRDIHRYFDEEHGLRAYWLTDSRISATRLLSQGYDIIVVTYEFLEASSRSIRTFQSRIEAHVNAVRDGRKRSQLPKRPTSALFSPLHITIQRPIKRTVVDEAQGISKRSGKRHQAVKLLPTTSIVCLSGTAAHNKWTAFSGYTDYVKGIPWKTHADFMRTFCGTNADENYPGIIETRLLQRFLQEFLVARPLDAFAASRLHGLRCWSLRFQLDQFDVNLVAAFTKKYKEESARAAQGGQDYSGQKRKGNHNSKSRAMLYAAKARAAAAHPLLLAEITNGNKKMEKMKKPRDASNNDKTNNKTPVLGKRTITSEDIDQNERALWLELVKRDPFLEQCSARVRAALTTYDWFRQQYPTEKIAICSTSLKLLDIVAEVLRRKYGIDAVRFDGSIPPLKRTFILRKLDTEPPCVPLLITAGSGAYGINIVSVSCIIQMEPWWNINNEEQLVCRAYRINQQSEVKYIRLEAENSEIDQEIMRVQLRKKAINDRLMAPLVHRHDEQPRILDLLL
ncbi:hypothetical protein AYO21_02066 [Fonsecaea monophora]|uniref:Helicase C-terminal domain-containing protein n=1 Tax=Fonsecaea monophora TaxID=254056 RepID=A0A177FL17_9EURO|nr:hypothetical protein AYO21_02066 [Fonsecaea monophora]OAG43839.1 hypothetical protein AYO21_02066 [Fonsecaea monophora]